MKTKSLRLLLLAAALALFAGCQNTLDYGEIANIRDSQQYMGPNNGFYDPWYGGTGAYVGAGGYGGVGVGISFPIIN